MKVIEPSNDLLGYKVQIYRNLTNGRWSIRKSGKVVGHAEMAILREPQFRIQMSGLEKARKEKRKNVHAYATGRLEVVFPLEEEWQLGLYGDHFREVSYDPFKKDNFFFCDTEDEVWTAHSAIFTMDGRCYVGVTNKDMPEGFEESPEIADEPTGRAPGDRPQRQVTFASPFSSWYGATTSRITWQSYFSTDTSG